MRIGLLETDILYDDLIEDYGSYGLMFENYFTQLGTANLEFVYYQVQQGELPQSLDECDAYIITGSKAGAYEDHHWIAPLSNWIVAANHAKTKLLGICFGHQLIAQALGGKVEMSDNGWGIGVRSMMTISDSPFSQPLPKYLDLIYSHKDQVVRLPAGANNFLGDNFCPHAGFTLGEHIVTLQGHPEFDAQYCERLLSRRAEIIGEPIYSKGINSLRQGTVETFIGRLILDFLQHAISQISNTHIEDSQAQNETEFN